MDFFRTIFDGLVGLSEKFPSAEVGVFAIAAFVALVLVAVVIGLTFLGSGAARFKSACRRVLAYLDDEQSVGDDNVADFTAECFGAKTPSALREAWVQFLGVRFGYPSEIISEQGVFEKAVKRGVSLRANIYIGAALIVTAFFAFWGLGAMGTAEVGVVLCLGLLIGAAGYLVLWLVARSEYAAARKKSRIRTTGELAKIVEESIPAKFRQNGPCARKTFQAIRIEVNGELDGLEEAVKGLALRLKKGGRICILTFHSLEDRIVKNAFRDLATDCICDKSLPVCVCGKKKEVEIITHKPLTASAEELQNNSRAKSAKLRIAERV